jgi:hypothetical protein
MILLGGVILTGDTEMLGGVILTGDTEMLGGVILTGDTEMLGGVILTGDTEALGEKPVTVPLCPPQISDGLTWNQNRTSAVSVCRLTV